MRLIRPGMVWAPWRSSELALDRVDDRFDPMTDAAQTAEAARFVFAVRRRKIAPSSAISRSNSSPAKPLSAITV